MSGDQRNGKRSAKPKDKVLVAVAWPYVNGNIHIGHYAGYLLPADICARYHRLMGRKVLMVSGSDCFGTPITVEADAKGKTPKEIVEEYHARDVELFKLLGLSYDLYTKTDTENHIKVTQDIFIKLLEKGYIYKDFSTQYFSENENRFLPDRYVEGKCPNCGFEGARSDQCDKCGKLLEQGELINPLSKNTKTSVILKQTEHYFLDWRLLELFLEEYINDGVKHSLGWRNWVFAETSGWLRQGLKPRAITRDLDWGVPLPLDHIPENQRIEHIENKRIYVWFDAVIGYLSASIEWAGSQVKGDWKEFWYGDDSTHYYFMGKDNLIFHTLFWPGQLHGYDDKLKLPDFFAINQFLNLEGQKFSKSRNVIVDTRYIVEKYGNDPVRFYLCLVMPENDDANFYWEDFGEKVNTVLIANYGNLVSRVLTLSRAMNFTEFNESSLFSGDELKNLGGEKGFEKGFESGVLREVLSAFEKAENHLDKCEFKLYLEQVLTLSQKTNELLTKLAPWKIADDGDELAKVMYNFCYLMTAVSFLFKPLLPDTSKKVFDALQIESPYWTALSDLPKLISQSKIGEFKPLFTKIDPQEIAKEKSHVGNIQV